MGICPKQHKAPDWCSNSLTSLVTPGKHSAQLWQSPTDTHVTGAVPFSVLDIGCVGLVRVALWTDDGWPWLVGVAQHVQHLFNYVVAIVSVPLPR